MLLKRVIPCLDVDRGRVVKGTNFVDIRDAGDPVELAVRYQEEGADEIVFLDITASHERRDTVAELARRCADDVFIPFTIGGGIRSVADAQVVLDAGSDKVSVLANRRGSTRWAAKSASQRSITAFTSAPRPCRRSVTISSMSRRWNGSRPRERKPEPRRMTRPRGSRSAYVFIL